MSKHIKKGTGSYMLFKVTRKLRRCSGCNKGIDNRNKSGICNSCQLRIREAVRKQKRKDGI